MLILAIILTAGMLLRVWYLQELVKAPDFSVPAIDAGFHDYWARALAGGDWTVPQGLGDPHIRTTPYVRPPGYPYFLAAIYALAGPLPLWPRLVQMVLGMINCVLIYLVGKNLFGSAVGLIAAALVSVYWVLIYFEGELLAPVLLIFLALVLIRVLILWIDKLTYPRAVAGGLLLGLFALVRPNIILFVPVLLAWTWWMGRRHDHRSALGKALLGFLPGMIIIIVPVTVRNYIVADDFVPITSNMGINFYIGNNEMTDCVSPIFPELSQLTGNSGWTCFDYPQIVRGIETKLATEMKHSQVSAYFSRKAIHYIRQHPLKFLDLTAKKTLLFWGPAEIANNKEIYYEKKYSKTLGYMPGFPAVLSLSIVGILSLFAGLRQHRPTAQWPSAPTRRQASAAVLILLFIATYFVSFLPFFVSARFRVPIIPLLLLFAAYGVYHVYQLFRTRRFGSGACWTAAWVVLYILASLHLFSHRPNLAKWHFDRGAAYSRRGLVNQASKEYRQTLQIVPNHAKAYNNLAIALSRQGLFDQAIQYYISALQLNPQTPQIHYNFGVTLSKQGKFDQAIEHYKQVLQILPKYHKAHNKLAEALLAHGKADQAIKYLNQAMQINPNHPQLYCNLGKAFQQQGKTDQAIEQYRQALKLDPNHSQATEMLKAALAGKQHPNSQ